MQHAVVRRGLHRWPVRRLAGVDGVLRDLLQRLPHAAPRRAGRAEPLRAAGERPQGGVPGLLGIGALRGEAGLRDGPLGRVEPVQRRVLRCARAEPVHRHLREGRRPAVHRRDPARRAVQPGRRHACVDRVRQHPEVELRHEPLEAVDGVHALVRRRPADALAAHRRAGLGRRPALRGHAKRGGAVQHAAVRCCGVRGLPLGPVVRVERLLALRRPALPQPVHREACERMRQAVRGP
mmetsp:Transcript_78633/g.202526  ORF Transcript_78633/g.202526 Transcript_78633/m.202526 type:complete len:237 (+) Transcript_78633:1296-2006(+)